MADDKRVFQELLIEIGTEEVPANYLAYGNENEQGFFREKFTKAFESINDPRVFEPGELKIYLTPRRMVFHMPRVVFSPQTITETVTGPPKDKAFDDSGVPTKMLEGFCKSKGVDAKSVKVIALKGKECVAFEKTVRPAPLQKRVQEICDAFASGLSFPKLMWWDDSGFKFPRPVRSIFCLVDDKAVKLRLGGVVSDGRIRLFNAGVRKLVSVAGAKRYFEALKDGGVMLDQEKRRSKIEAEVKKITAKYKGVYRQQPALLDEVTYLTENPVSISGEFEQTYADLPGQVLTSSLSKSQRLFSICGGDGRHLPYFIAVLDGKPAAGAKNAATVAAILKAKLQDSHFFYREDMKLYAGGEQAEGVKKLRRELDQLLFLKGAGSMLSRADRMAGCASVLANGWGLDDKELRDLLKAIPVAKIDLLTQMVGEFPELQGVIGACYLKASGANEIEGCAQAVQEQYLPLSPEGNAPATRAGGALSVLDKADLIVSCFATGKVPSSSQDPYALKRAMAGILRVAYECKLRICWQDLTSRLVEALSEKFPEISEKRSVICTQLEGFFAERSAQYFEQKGYERDMVAAVMASGTADILDTYERIEILSGFRKSDAFQRSVKVIERTSNILKGAKDFTPAEVDPHLFTDEEERLLWKAVGENGDDIRHVIEQRSYKEATNLYANAFSDILHIFFDKVLVNSEDAAVRRNRLSLMAAVRRLYVEGVADLSRIRSDS